MTDPETGDSTQYTLLPLVRQGFRPDRAESGGTLTGRSTIDLRTTVQGRRIDGSGTEERSRDVSLRMYGPGDITGIDDRQVVRTVPKADTTRFPPNYFPHVEFYRPDLPWMFSPESTGAAENFRTRPWLTLVVVPTEGEATVEPPGMRPTPVLKTPTTELPPVEETWAWAHVQTTGDIYGTTPDGEPITDEDRKQLFESRSDQTVSRVICPRKLSAGTSYVACVVPTFEPGRKAGLGVEPFGDLADDETPTIEPAWSVSSDGTVELPVYYRWEFATGEGGDFEAALDELVPRNLSRPEFGVGYEEVDLSEPGPAALRTTGTVTGRKTGPLTTPGPDPERIEEDTLYDLLTDPDAVVGTPSGSPASNLPVLGPPEYGKWPPLAMDWPQSPGDGARLQWLAQLNLAPRHRIAASLGVKVVQEHQDRLVTDAWEQFEGLERESESTIDRYRVGGELESEVETTLQGIGSARRFRDVERAREAIRVKHVLDDLNDVGRGTGGAVDPRLEREGFGRDVVESVLRNGRMSPNTEDVLDDIESGGAPTGTTHPVEEVSMPGDGTVVPGGTIQPGGKRLLGGGGIRAEDALGEHYGSFVSMANELGEVRRRRLRDDESDTDARVDGGAGVPERFPESGSLTRVDELTRPGGLLARRAPDDVDLDGVRESMFAEGSVPGAAPPGSGTVTTAPDWLLDEQGRRMSLLEAMRTLPGEMKSIPKALVQLETLAADARSLRDRLDEVGEALGDAEEAGAGSRAAEVAARYPSILEGASLLDDLIDAANHGVSGAIAADLPAVSDELTEHRAASSFERAARAQEVLEEAAGRIHAGTVPAGEGGRDGEDGGRDDGSDRSAGDAGGAAIRPADVEAGREAASEIAAETDALSAFIPTEVEREREMQAMEGTLPGEGPTAPEGLLYERIPLRDQPDVPGLLAGRDWSIDRAGRDSFGTGFSEADRSAVREVFRTGPMAAPEFDHPMFEPLRELSVDHVLPGVGNVPNNTIGALMTDREFIEAYMAGLSHEMARELLWREYPTDRRGTYFRTFWNYDGPGDPEAPHDIQKIHKWNGPLGSNPPGGARDLERVVLLVKGDLLQAFPNTRIYMVPAVAERRQGVSRSDATTGHDLWDRKPLFENEVFDPPNTAIHDATSSPGAYDPENRPGASFTTRTLEDGSQQRHVKPEDPIVRGKLGDETTFMTFDIDADAARGRELSYTDDLNPKYPDQLGWFFVFEEPVGEIRFGLDANDEQIEDIREASHPSGEKASECRTDVGSYPAKVDLSSSHRRGDDDENLPDGCKPWQKRRGEEAGWDGLSWGHLVRHDDLPSPESDADAQIEAEQALVDEIDHVMVEGEDSHAPGGVNDGVGDDAAWRTDDATWGKNSAHMARITWQRPVRAAYHVDDLLPDDTGALQGGGSP